MNDLDLDELLAESIAPLPAPMTREARTMAAATKPARIRRGRMPRPRWLIPMIFACSVALTGAASLTAVQLSVWPWVSLPEGFDRTVRIPVEYTTDEGHVEVCGAYIELRNASASDLAALNAAIDARDWEGFGQAVRPRGIYCVDQTPSSLPVGSAKCRRRPPGNSYGSWRIVPPAFSIAIFVASRSSE
jgi:hypothetical protein